MAARSGTVIPLPTPFDADGESLKTFLDKSLNLR